MVITECHASQTNIGSVEQERLCYNLLESSAVSRSEQQAHNVVRDLTQTGENCWDRKLLLLPLSASPRRSVVHSLLSIAAVRATQGRAREQLYIHRERHMVTWMISRICMHAWVIQVHYMSLPSPICMEMSAGNLIL